jgi:hypothetical protein
VGKLRGCGKRGQCVSGTKCVGKLQGCGKRVVRVWERLAGNWLSRSQCGRGGRGRGTERLRFSVWEGSGVGVYGSFGEHQEEGERVRGRHDVGVQDRQLHAVARVGEMHCE